ncbi:MAG TPA: SRPBCC family protein [Acidimicrobiales bacterium]|nr:SRPBCC family protein [Acidimicrobiales bacterium]
MEYTLHATTVVDAPPALVFERITDIDRLPDWNVEIPRVVERPAALGVGVEWVVEIHAMKSHWNSRSRVTELDPERGRFCYRSQTDDGNPSHADWRWQLSPGPVGTRVDVEADIRPRTFWRRYLLSGLRRPVLARAMRRSLRVLHDQVSTQREEA